MEKTLKFKEVENTQSFVIFSHNIMGKVITDILWTFGVKQTAEVLVTDSPV